VELDRRGSFIDSEDNAPETILSKPAIGLALIALASAVQAEAQQSVQVPRGPAVTIDGSVNDDEWRNALRIEHPAGTVVRLLRGADHLYLGVTSERQGFSSLCIAIGNEVHVLHASAALGRVTYRPSGDVWNSPDTAFRYSMRNTALDDSARSQRAAYLAENGWVASTVRMGNDQRSQELQIALSRFPLPFRIALGRWLFTNNTEWWPGTLTDHEGCLSLPLVRGSVPQGITFKPSFWVTIENR
jgi:hypothetical protein